jgi:hypothetical protein
VVRADRLMSLVLLLQARGHEQVPHMRTLAEALRLAGCACAD